MRGREPQTDLKGKRKQVPGMGGRLFWGERRTYNAVMLGLKMTVASIQGTPSLSLGLLALMEASPVCTPAQWRNTWRGLMSHMKPVR